MIACIFILGGTAIVAAVVVVYGPPAADAVWARWWKFQNRERRLARQDKADRK